MSDPVLPMVLNTQDVESLTYVIQRHVQAARPGIRRTVERQQVARTRAAIRPHATTP